MYIGITYDELLSYDSLVLLRCEKPYALKYWLLIFTGFCGEEKSKRKDKKRM